MKAKHIKKLRHEVSNMKPYNIYETASLFGNIYIHPDNIVVTVLAKSFDHAMTRFIRWYYRKYKKRHGSANFKHYVNNNRTTEMWGRVAVQRIDNYIEYYK